MKFSTDICKKKLVFIILSIPNLKLLLDKILTDERWDLKFIGMQIIIEGLALAAFQMLKSITKDPLLKTITSLCGKR